MRDGWRLVALGDLCTLTKGVTPTMKARPGQYPLVVTAADFLSSDEYQFDGEAVCVPLVSSTGHGHASLKRVHYASGKFAVANIITALQRHEKAPVDMKFLWLLLDHGRDDIIVPLMKGTANVSLSQRGLAGAEILLPPLDEQRRIVDLIGALDDTIAAAEQMAAVSASLLAEIRRPPEAAETRPLGDMVTMRSGPSWKAADEAKAPRDGYERVLGITNTPAGPSLDLTDERYVSDLPATAQRLDESSLVMIRTNGNRSRIGNVYRATSEVEGLAVSAFQIAIRPHHPGDSPLLYWFLGSPKVQRLISENASGSTGLGNIAVGWLKKLEVPIFESTVLDSYVARCEGAAQVHQSATDLLRRLRDLRSDLLSALLSGAHPIPESYEELMEDLAA